MRLTDGAATVLAIVLTAGCESGSNAPQPTSWPTTEGSSESTDVPQADRIDQIDIDGADDSPITWQLPEGAGTDDPVGVAQRYIAIIQQVGAPDADLDPAAVDSVATDAAAASARNAIAAGPSQPDASSGPVWVWLDAAQENGDRAVVKGCADVGYFQPAGAPTPAEFRAEAWTTELERVEGSGHTAEWKVYRFSTGPANDADPFEKQCAGWATHD